MPHYHKLGKIPPKRHTVFKKDDGSLYSEELVSTEGFSDVYSLVYHCHPPTKVLSIEDAYSIKPEVAIEHNMQNSSFNGFSVRPVDDYLLNRKNGSCWKIGRQII